MATTAGMRGVFVLIGGFLVHLSLGSFFTFGNFSPYIISYMRNRTNEVDLRNVDGLWVTSIGAIGNFVGLTGGGILDKRFGPRVATAAGGAIFSSSVMLTSLTVKTSFNWVIVTYGLMFCVGMMMGYGPPVQTAIKWLPERPSLAAGLIVSGFGGGSLIFNQVITAFINPDNLAPDLITDDGERYFTDPDLLDRVPTCFLILGACYLGMQLMGIALLTTPPSSGTTTEFNENSQSEKIHEKEANCTKEPNGIQLSVICDGQSNGGFTLSDSSTSTTTVNDSEKAYMEVKYPQTARKGEYSIKEAIIVMFKCRSFYILWLTILCMECSLQYCNGLYKAYGQTFIKDDQFLSIVGSISSVFNSVFRPAWGVFMDRFGYKVSVWCITGGFVAFLATLVLTEYMGKPGFFVWICLIYGLSCGIWTVAPSTLARLFGASNMSVNYGFSNLAISCGSIICGVTAITLKSTIGWHGIFFMAAGISALPVLLTFFFNGIDLNGKRI